MTEAAEGQNSRQPRKTEGAGVPARKNADADVPVRKNEDRVCGYLGLSARGRNLVSGEFSVEKAVRSGTAPLVLLAGDASDNTVKQFENLCSHYGIPCARFGTREILGRAVGKDFRASAAVTDEKLAEAIRKFL